jgi:hypothetical protein
VKRYYSTLHEHEITRDDVRLIDGELWMRVKARGFRIDLAEKVYGKEWYRKFLPTKIHTDTFVDYTYDFEMTEAGAALKMIENALDAHSLEVEFWFREDEDILPISCTWAQFEAATNEWFFEPEPMRDKNRPLWQNVIDAARALDRQRVDAAVEIYLELAGDGMDECWEGAELCDVQAAMGSDTPGIDAVRAAQNARESQP